VNWSYWGFAALIAWSVSSRVPKFDSISIGQAVAVAFFLCEVVNGSCHLALQMRPKEHVVQKGFLFDVITAPTPPRRSSFGCLSPVLPAFGAVQMLVWAGDKRRRLISQWPKVEAG
jgi:hypothetical protein